MIAQLLAVEGYNSIEKIVNATVNDIEKIEGFDTELATEIYARASQFMENEKAELEKLIQESSLDDYLKNIKELDNKMLSTLIDNKILTRQDLADLATDELVGKEGILQKRVEKNIAEKIIMDAREIYLNS
jgi:N utilization substance protein A